MIIPRGFFGSCAYPLSTLKSSFFVVFYFTCPGGEIGNRARFRYVCRKAWRFKSSPGHKKIIRFADFFVPGKRVPLRHSCEDLKPFFLICES